ncbi:MAG: flagellar motor protein MotB [Candidatus Electryonea clarkiae]|nr:flagellar motor protein MotB [Candidatus Electryonea clarkiae]
MKTQEKNHKRQSAFWEYYKNRDQSGASEREDDSWMVSYGDMMTLLLVFFVLLVSVSTIDSSKLQLITQSMRNAMGSEVEYVPTLREIEETLKQSVEELNLQEVVQVARDKHGVQLLLRGESFFPSGEATLYPKTHSFLTMVASEITRTPYNMSIEGHTDNIPISTARFPSNWELSGARAAAVVRFFEENDLDRDRFRIAGYADTKPVDATLGNSTPAARALNRRVVITFLNEFAEGMEKK